MDQATIPMNENDEVFRLAKPRRRWLVKRFDDNARAWTHIAIEAESLMFSTGVALFIANDVVVAAFAQFDHIEFAGEVPNGAA